MSENAETQNKVSEEKPVIFCGLPSYSGRNPAMQTYQILTQGQHIPIIYQPYQFSLLACGFNALWCQALNARKTHGVTHFLMMHDDIVPHPGQKWLDTLLDEMKKNEADVISVIVPLKSEHGLTSTGIKFGAPFHEWLVKRYTMTEVYALPETFTHPQLVINTGMMLVDIRKPWAEQICFNVKDQIVKNAEGIFEPKVFSEDWNFSEDAKALGAKIFATRKVLVDHYGSFQFANNEPWGLMKTDEFFIQQAAPIQK